MPWKTAIRVPLHVTIQRAKEDLRRGKRATTAAGKFVREEIEHIRQGKHGAQSAKQAIAIGLSKARRAGVALKASGRVKAEPKPRPSAEHDEEIGQGHRKPHAPSKARGRAVESARRRAPRSAASHSARSRQARTTARPRKRSKARRARRS
jgi:hypothetical protein